MLILLNNNIHSLESPVIFANDRGLLLGDGIFETIKFDNGKLLFFEEHYNRLKESAKSIMLKFNMSLDELKDKCCKTISVNKENILHSAVIRITLTRGSAQRGINIPAEQSPTLLISAFSYTQSNVSFPTAWLTNIKRNEHSIITKLKTLNYLEPVLARQQALDNGFDEGIMFNTQGAITECSTANIFVVIDGKIYTPKISDGILPGITRKLVMQLAKINNIYISEKTLYPKDLLIATEVFQTNSLIGIQSLSKINYHNLLFGKNAPITNKITELFNLFQANATN